MCGTLPKLLGGIFLKGDISMKFDLNKIKWTKVVEAIHSLTKLIKSLITFVRVSDGLIEALAVFFYKWSRNRYVHLYTL